MVDKTEANEKKDSTAKSAPLATAAKNTAPKVAVAETVAAVEVPNEKKTTQPNNAPEKAAVRATNVQFFRKDILGGSSREGLVRDITLRSRTGRSLYNMVYERIDTYLHRPKEVAGLVIARDANDEMLKIINSRITELEQFVAKRHKRVKSLYDAATAIDSYEQDPSNNLEVKAVFSTGYANRYISVLVMIDEACFMASYLEMTGELDMQQEAQLTSELYRKNVQISRNLMVFIGRAIIGIRRKLKDGRQEKEALRA